MLCSSPEHPFDFESIEPRPTVPILSTGVRHRNQHGLTSMVCMQYHVSSKGCHKVEKVFEIGKGANASSPLAQIVTSSTHRASIPISEAKCYAKPPRITHSLNDHCNDSAQVSMKR